MDQVGIARRAASGESDHGSVGLPWPSPAIAYELDLPFRLPTTDLTVFAAVFARQIGFPVPANLFLVAAGALAAAQKLGLLDALGLAIIACVLADWVWYEAGRRKAVTGCCTSFTASRQIPRPQSSRRKNASLNMDRRSSSWRNSFPVCPRRWWARLGPRACVDELQTVQRLEWTL